MSSYLASVISLKPLSAPLGLLGDTSSTLGDSTLNPAGKTYSQVYMSISETHSILIDADRVLMKN